MHSAQPAGFEGIKARVTPLPFSYAYCTVAIQPVTIMSVLVTLSLLSLCFVGISAQNDEEFKVTEPKAGDTVTISKYTTDGVVVPIKWTVPAALADKPVIISLVQGNDLSSLSTVSQINGASSLHCKPSPSHEQSAENQRHQLAHRTPAHIHGAATSSTARSYSDTAMARHRGVITRLN